MPNRSYTVLVHKGEEDGWTSVPALPGCGSQGETIDEALAMTAEAIELMLEVLAEKGHPIPDDTDPIETIRQVSIPA